MGIEVVLLAASAAVGAASTIYQISQAKKAEKAQKNSTETQKAAARVQEDIERRKALKEERIKRARLMNTSSQTGTSDSSGEISAGNALSASFAEGVSSQAFQTETNVALSGFNQQIATAKSNISTANAFTDLFSTSISLYDKGAEWGIWGNG